MKRKSTIALGLILTVYFIAWGTKYANGLAKPMANARYFYFGQAPAHWSDKFIYTIFCPIYKIRYYLQNIKDEGHWDVHWSDRKEVTLPTPEELGLEDNFN